MATPATAELAYDDEGEGPPVVLLHGLTFDRRTWRPIIEHLESVRTIAVDLPAHGQSGGVPAPLEEVTAQLHELLVAQGVERPIVVGHSMSGGLALLYVATYPGRGVVLVDNGPDIRPFAQIAQQVEPALRGPGFAAVWERFESTLGLDLISEPVRSLVLETHVVDQAVVIGYWEMVLRADPDELQAWIDEHLRRMDVPCLGVFGRPVTDAERERFGWMPDVQLEEWVGGGHFVHLVDPDRFAIRLRRFVDHCTAGAA